MRSSAVSPAPPVGALSSAAAGAYLGGFTPKTLANWRALGRGPRYIRTGEFHSAVVYRVSDLDAYLADRVVGGS